MSDSEFRRHVLFFQGRLSGVMIRLGGKNTFWHWTRGGTLMCHDWARKELPTKCTTCLVTWIFLPYELSSINTCCTRTSTWLIRVSVSKHNRYWRKFFWNFLWRTCGSPLSAQSYRSLQCTLSRAQCIFEVFVLLTASLMQRTCHGSTWNKKVVALYKLLDCRNSGV